MFKKKLYKKLDELNEVMSKANVSEIIYLLGNKKEMFMRNILAGIGRGIGIGIGVTVVTALIIYVLQKIVKLNIPIIGKYVADIVEIVQNTQKLR